MSYSRSAYIFQQALANSSITPTVTGTVGSFSISPDLQADTGLTFNYSNAAISGTPTIVKSATNYTVTVSNSGGSTSTTISITVVPNAVVLSMPSGILKTGQTTSYTTGDDGTYQKGVARTFGGTTGLVWQRCSGGQNFDHSCSGTATFYTWAQANTYCSSLGLLGKSWRLPTYNELANLAEYNYSTGPTINSILFPNTVANNYWSSSAYLKLTNNAYLINFDYGFVGTTNKANTDGYVRCIYGP